MALKLCASCEKANRKLAGSQVYFPKGNTRIDHSRVFTLQKAGKSVGQIASTLKCSVKWVYQILKDGK